MTYERIYKDCDDICIPGTDACFIHQPEYPAEARAIVEQGRAGVAALSESREVNPVAQARVTRVVCLTSDRFRELMKSFSVLAVAGAGPLDMSTWSNEDHEDVRRWSCGQLEDMPEVLAAHVRKIEGK